MVTVEGCTFISSPFRHQRVALATLDLLPGKEFPQRRGRDVVLSEWSHESLIDAKKSWPWPAPTLTPCQLQLAQLFRTQASRPPKCSL